MFLSLVVMLSNNELQTDETALLVKTDRHFLALDRIFMLPAGWLSVD
ncbi:hypothetical protein [Pantoea cypripedii]|nr:hypothetical protein [Pantoea cypripedii]